MLSKLKINLPLILGLGLLLRLGALFFYPDQNFPDAQGYARAGEEFFASGQLSSTVHMPFYSTWAYLMGSPLVLKISDIIFSLISIYLIYAITVSIAKNRTAGLIAATMAAVYPYFIFYSVSRLTETSFVFLLLLGVHWLFKSRYFLASIALVLSILIRPTFELFYPILIISFGISLSFKQNIKNLSIYGLVYVVLLSPWWVHNYDKYGQFVRLNLGLGHTLYSGNNPLNETGGGVVDDTIVELDMSEFNHIHDQVARDEALKNAAIAYIKQDPRHFIKMSWIKFKRFWQLWPFASAYTDWKYKVISVLSYGVILGLSMVFALFYTRRYWPAVLPIYLIISYLTAVHMILITSIRYRFPLEPFLVMMAAIVLYDWVSRRTFTK